MNRLLRWSLKWSFEELSAGCRWWYPGEDSSREIQEGWGTAADMFTQLDRWCHGLLLILSQTTCRNHLRNFDRKLLPCWHRRTHNLCSWLWPRRFLKQICLAIECEVQYWHFANHVWVWFRAEITEICCKFLVRRLCQFCFCQVLVGQHSPTDGNLVTRSQCLLQFLCDHNSKHDACLSIYGLWCWIWSHQIIKSSNHYRTKEAELKM